MTGLKCKFRKSHHWLFLVSVLLITSPGKQKRSGMMRRGSFHRHFFPAFKSSPSREADNLHCTQWRGLIGLNSAKFNSDNMGLNSNYCSAYKVPRISINFSLELMTAPITWSIDGISKEKHHD